MAGFRRANQQQVNAFRINSEYLFKHYFEGDEVFDRLRNYYNHSQYRFEVPVEDFEEIKSFLSDHGYALTTVYAVEEYVVVRKYTEHPGNIFKQSVIQRSIPEYNCFLMTDQATVSEAVGKSSSAKRLTESAIDNPF